MVVLNTLGGECEAEGGKAPYLQKIIREADSFFAFGGWVIFIMCELFTVLRLLLQDFYYR
jgi:hypothetical protein